MTTSTYTYHDNHPHHHGGEVVPLGHHHHHHRHGEDEVVRLRHEERRDVGKVEHDVSKMCGAVFHAMWYEVYDLWDGILLSIGSTLYKMGF